MKKENIKVEKEIFAFETNEIYPNEVKGNIFIPAYGPNLKHYYYYIDFDNKKIHHWNIDLTDEKEILKKQLNVNDFSFIPWNQSSIDDYLELVFFPHSAEIYNNKIYVSYVSGNHFVEIDLINNKCNFIYDKEAISKVYSSTNQIFNGEIYYTRWELEDSIIWENDPNYKIKLDIGKYNIKDDRFIHLKTIEGTDDIHSTCISPDGKYIYILEMCQDPIIRYPKDIIDGELMKNIFENRLRKSHLITYSVNDQKENILDIYNCPAHIEFDDNGYLYILEHNNSINKGGIMSFGHSRIHRIQTIDGISKIIDTYENKKMYRAPSHKIGKYNDVNLFVCPSFSNQIVLIEKDDMIDYKTIHLSKNVKYPNYSDGPYMYPNATFDKTPYTVHQILDTRFLLLSSVWGITIYDFVNEKRISQIYYNKNNSPLISVGHSTYYQN